MLKLDLLIGKLIILAFCVIFISQIAYSQFVPILHPARLPDDQEQIKAAIASLSQSLQVRNISNVQALFKLTPGIAALQKTNIQAQEINSIEVEKLDIDKNIATAQCQFVGCDGSVVKDIPVRLEKVGVSWFITESSELSEIISPMLSALLTKDSVNKKTMGITGDQTITSSNLIISNTMLKSIPHPLTLAVENVYLIDWDFTYNKIGKRFFSTNAILDIEGLYNSSNPADEGIVFYLDPIWNRIVYAANGWIKSYGDNTGDYQFSKPLAMTIDSHDTIFVADAESRKIVKLVYNRGTQLLSQVSTLEISGIMRPVDIAIDQVGTFSNPSNVGDDRIWVVDDFKGLLVGFKRNGEIYRTYTNYGNYRLKQPVKVLAQDNDRIAFIDRGRNTFVVIVGSTGQVINRTQFDMASSHLSCIGQDINNEWWVGDDAQMMYHKFTINGTYLASFELSNNPAQNFQFPVSISKAPYNNSSPPARCQYVYTSDPWDQYKGMRAFLPAVDALNITFNPYVELCYAGVNFILTNQAYVRGRLTLSNDTTTIAYYDYGVLPAGIQTLKIDKFKLKKAETYYKFTIELQPRYWLNYNIVSPVNWWYYPVYFSTAVQTTWAASVTPVPTGTNCVSSGSIGTWKVTPTCPIGFYTYKWYRNSYVGDENWGYLGPTLIPEISFMATGGSFELRCDIIHRDGDTKTAYYTNCPSSNPPGDAGCPFVYTWDGAKFQEDNNILPQSEYADNTGKDVTDYYRLRKILNAQNGKYVLQIREFENEKSYLDQFRLIAVDHPANTKIDVSATGEIYQYVTPLALNRARVRGLDVTQNLSASDSNRIIVNPGDTLHISVLNLLAKNTRSLQTSVGGGEGDGDGLPKTNKMANVIQTRSSPSNPIGFTFRQRPTLVYTPLTLDSTNSLDIIWTQKARLDYFNFGISVPQTYTSRELSLSSAVHSSNGDVTALLLKKDYSYSTLMPGSSIELRFNSIPGPSSNKKRTFILLSEGRYETIEDSSQNNRLSRSLQEVTSFKLDRNYPNPFNPVTRIAFQLPVEGHISLIIYDLLGREVARLIDGYIEKGYHSIEWDAGNNSSGLYFCRFTVSDGFGKDLYSEIQKLLVMR